MGVVERPYIRAIDPIELPIVGMYSPCWADDYYPRETARLRIALTPDGLTGPRMELHIEDTDPVATCDCGNRSFGDSISDAVTAWAKHVVNTPGCREKL